MSTEIWLVYLSAVLAFMSTPGPSHLLMLSNSIGQGFRKSTATALGDLSANFLQMLAASFGLVSILEEGQQYFVLVKWTGVAYLAYLGIKLMRSHETSTGFGRPASVKRSAQSLYWQGFITSAVNPKAVVFFAALFPQFIVLSEPLIPQFTLLSVTYLVIDGLFLCFYGKFAEFFAKQLNSSIGQYLNQISGGLFIGAAILLGFGSHRGLDI